MLEYSVGMVPVNLLSFSEIMTTCNQLVKLGIRIVPVNELESNLKAIKLVIDPNVVGIVPVKLL